MNVPCCLLMGPTHCMGTNSVGSQRFAAPIGCAKTPLAALVGDADGFALRRQRLFRGDDVECHWLASFSSGYFSTSRLAYQATSRAQPSGESHQNVATPQRIQMARSEPMMLCGVAMLR